MQTFDIHSTMREGDILRKGLNTALGFCNEGCTENPRQRIETQALHSTRQESRTLT
jgi:adenylylsulfate kinase-like enzyme